MRSCCTLLEVDEAEEHVLEPEPDDVVLGDGQVAVGGEPRDRCLDGRGRARLDADEVGSKVAGALAGLDRDDPGDGRYGDRGGVIGTADYQ
jgi:hypothetical protein